MRKLLVLVLATAACSGDGEPQPTGPITCEWPNTAGDFTTELSSCDEAVATARKIVAEMLPDATNDGLDIFASSFCMGLQVGPVTAPASDIPYAQRLHDAGVCPGDINNLTPRP